MSDSTTPSTRRRSSWLGPTVAALLALGGTVLVGLVDLAAAGAEGTTGVAPVVGTAPTSVPWLLFVAGFLAFGAFIFGAWWIHRHDDPSSMNEPSSHPGL